MRLNGEREALKAKEAAERMEEEAAWKNVQTMQEKERERERKSIAFRLAEVCIYLTQCVFLSLIPN